MTSQMRHSLHFTVLKNDEFSVVLKNIKLAKLKHQKSKHEMTETALFTLS